MRVHINKYEKNAASVAAPHSKSMAHRLLICAGLAQGTSTVRGVDVSEDILATIDCLRALGAEISVLTDDGRETEDIELQQDAVLKVKGTDLSLTEPAVLRCRESGSTLRFTAPAATLTGQEITLAGSSSLMSRPLTVYDDLFREKGMKVWRADNAMLVQGSIPAGTYTIPGNISSQFVSGLLLALPLLRDDSCISIEGRVESKPYIDMTIAVMRQYGVWADWKADGLSLSIPGGQTYKAQDVTVEGDWSGASFLLALGANVTGLDEYSVQGDKICREYFSRLDKGCCELDITDCPDLAPVLAAYAASRSGCILTGTARLKYKESDRGAALKEELEKYGISVEQKDNTISVGCGVVSPAEVLCGHNDHRIVMALAVLCTETGGVIDGAEAVNKSFPDFFHKLSEIGVDMSMEG